MTPMTKEIRNALEDLARCDIPRSVYNAIADELHWTRRMYPREVAQHTLNRVVENDLIPIVEMLDEFNDPSPPNTEAYVALHVVKECLETLSEPEACP